MRSTPLKAFAKGSPAKHANTSASPGNFGRVGEKEYKDKHPGPGNPKTRGYHIGHKGDSPIYPEKTN
jgi:hypothetical protein